MHSLIDKVAIVTGGANGIGEHIVQEFIKEQAKYVAILDVDEESGKALENKLKAEYGTDGIEYFKCDVTEDNELHGIFDQIFKKFGKIDIVVNNAGIASDKMNTYKKEIEINFTASVSSVLKSLELMRADRGGPGGTIINVSSVAALTLMSPSIFIYAATKSAILHLSVCMGKEDYNRHTQVRIMTVCFGATDTDIVNKMASFDDLATDNLRNIVDTAKNLGALQSPNDAAQGVVECYKTGKSGSVWLIDEGKIMDISDRVYDAYKILSSGIKVGQ